MAATAAPAAKPTLVRELEAIVGEANVLWNDYDLMLYEYDGSIDKSRPTAVVFPTSGQHVAELVRLATRSDVPYTARGAGTGLSGGAIPVDGGLLISFAKMNRVLQLEPKDLRGVVEPGVVNLRFGQSLIAYGLTYVPDPSSQKACTIGGNVGENSGGPHTLRYGVTTNHTQGLKIVLPDGETIETGGHAADYPGYDLTGLFVGSEGTMGLVTEIVVRLVPASEAVKTLLAIFPSVRAASSAVAAIIAARIVPAALEMMDNTTIQAVEQATHAGYPMDAEAVLLIEIEGLREEMDELADRITRLCSENAALDVRVAKSDKERALLWAGRKGAFGAIGRISPDYYTVDGVVPRSKLPDVLDRIQELSQESGLRIANVFHAGDGNLHPLVLFDADDPEQLRTAVKVGARIMEACAEAGGSLTGEHGIGMEKNELMPLIFSEDDLDVMKKVKRAIDPEGRCNPGKVFPTPGRCLEMLPNRNRAAGW